MKSKENINCSTFFKTDFITGFYVRNGTGTGN